MDNVDVAIGVVDGKVVARWHQPVTEITFDARNAYQIAEAMARAAHEAHTGHKVTVSEDASYIAQQTRQRITDAVRVKCIQRVALMLGSMERHRRTPGQIAMALVDAVLKEVA